MAVDLTALAAVPLLLLLARQSRRRWRGGHADSIWSEAATARRERARTADTMAAADSATTNTQKNPASA
ncbi:hypothetical protein [Tahibacter caeni]|uniref:hypothetical protein n=1 Tax=Tahibacter caeni TaxID=1453545 RepID=UPI0021487F70|nr:hypothetical protein [Tahibacter caeni]